MPSALYALCASAAKALSALNVEYSPAELLRRCREEIEAAIDLLAMLDNCDQTPTDVAYVAVLAHYVELPDENLEVLNGLDLEIDNPLIYH